MAHVLASLFALHGPGVLALLVVTIMLVMWGLSKR